MTSRLKNRELFIMGNVHSEAMRASLTNVDKGNSSLGGKVAQITLRDHWDSLILWICSEERLYGRDENWARPVLNWYFSSWPAHSSTERERNWNPNLTTTAWISPKWSGKTELKSWVGKRGERGADLALWSIHRPAAWLQEQSLPQPKPEAIAIMGNSFYNYKT